MCKNRFFYLFLYLYLFLFLTEMVSATIPLEITSEKMTCDRDEGFCVAKEHAKAVYGDGKTEPVQTLKASMFTIIFQKKDKNSTPKGEGEESLLGNQQVKEIHADGDVSFVRDDLTILSDRAEYAEASSIVHFYGHVRINQGKVAYCESEHATYDKLNNTFTIHTKGKMIIDIHDKEKRSRSQ